MFSSLIYLFIMSLITMVTSRIVKKKQKQMRIYKRKKAVLV